MMTSKNKLMGSNQSNVQPILVIESDNDARPLLIENLTRQGFQLMVALSEIDALPQLRGASQLPAIILMNQVNRTVEETLSKGQQLRQDADLSPQVPIVIMADRYGADLEGTIVQVGERDYIIYQEDAQQLFDLLIRLYNCL
ncbi:hypothetical protein C7271_21440 [filamentous cyanobacterium CCP5]|nr:hypothetical protein C7271_21440 [filamentous cyanobacterium CCP5]